MADDPPVVELARISVSMVVCFVLDGLFQQLGVRY
jgi:hypothetical protein